MPRVFQVQTRYPSGKELVIKVMPSNIPQRWPNRELPSPEGEGLRMITTAKEAAEYVNRTCHNRLNAILFEWPESCEPLEEVLNSENLEIPAHVKALIADPGKDANGKPIRKPVSEPAIPTPTVIVEGGVV